MKSRCVALLLALSMFTVSLHAKIYVDDDALGDLSPYDPNLSDPNEDGSAKHPFDSIQEAIDIAVDGETIVVSPGRYLSSDPWEYGEIDFKGKNIRLVSQAATSFNWAEITILCGVVIFRGDENPNCLLQGFKIQNHNYGGILGNKTRATISHCIISGNGPCGATVLKDVHGRVTNCLIVDNTTFHDCGVMPVVYGCPELINCTIANNLSGIAINCADPPGIHDITIRNCIIHGNQDYEQVRILNSAGDKTIEYCLLENWRATSAALSGRREPTLLDGDPDFVQPGYWEDQPLGRTRESGPATGKTMKVLIDGDYHLRSQGWRFSRQSVHGSHWVGDPTTSPGVDAGDPMDGLGEEFEGIPDDPEGQWGFNHAIDLGAYGGTKEGSLSPTWASPAPGAGAVDLHDYWPLGGLYGPHWYVHNPQGTARQFYRNAMFGVHNGASFQVWTLETKDAPDWVTTVYCVYLYVDQTFYMVTDKAMLSLLPNPLPQFQAKYPQYLVVGATIQVPYDPFVKGTVEYRSVLVTRGTLAEVLAGTSMDPAQFLAGSWPDVIALKEMNEDGTTANPIAIFARGFGPLMIAGQPIEGAQIRGRVFGTMETPPGGTRTR